MNSIRGTVQTLLLATGLLAMVGGYGRQDLWWWWVPAAVAGLIALFRFAQHPNENTARGLARWRSLPNSRRSQYLLGGKLIAASIVYLAGLELVFVVANQATWTFWAAVVGGVIWGFLAIRFSLQIVRIEQKKGDSAED
jgi:hypothetical protein